MLRRRLMQLVAAAIGTTASTTASASENNLSGMEKCIYIYDRIYSDDNLARHVHMRPQQDALTVAYDCTVSPVDLRIAQDDENILVDIIEQSDTRERHVDVTYRYWQHPRPTGDAI